MSQIHPLWEEASEISKTDALLLVRKNLEASMQNLLDKFSVHGDDGICVSDVEDALMVVRADLYELGEVLKQ